jgi:hypothetical protein
MLQLYYTRALFARAALWLAVRPTRLCLCGPAGVWRYTPLRCKTPENTTIIAYRSAAAPAAASVAAEYSEAI